MDGEFPSNRHKERGGRPPVEKPGEKKIEQIVQSEVVRRKKPLGKRLAELFVGGDAKSVWGYVAFDVLIPAAKDAIADAVSQGVERMVFGESSSRRRGSAGRGSSGPYISYNRYSAQSGRKEEPRRNEISRRGRASHNFDEIILATRAEADEVIERLFDLASKYDSATVADLYDLVGISGNYTDDKWGWVDLRGAGVTRVRSGYLLDLPNPEPLD